MPVKTVIYINMDHEAKNEDETVKRKRGNQKRRTFLGCTTYRRAHGTHQHEESVGWPGGQEI